MAFATSAARPVLVTDGLTGSRLGSTHRPLRDVVCDEMRKKIIDGTYAPGERLVEERIAESLGVSRNPIREALRVLEAEGFVKMAPRRGAFVASLSDQEIEEFLEVHTALEALAARLAAKNATPDDIFRLKRSLSAAQSALEKSDTARLSRLNLRFHNELLDATHNHYLREIVLSLRDRVDMVFSSTARQRGAHSFPEHVALLRAVEERDEERAAQLMSEHMAMARRSVLKVRAHQAHEAEPRP